jgi:hypothetical protein
VQESFDPLIISQYVDPSTVLSSFVLLAFVVVVGRYLEPHGCGHGT